MLTDLAARFWRWLTTDPVLARRAAEAYIRQEFERHPAERGDNWRG